MYLLIFSQICRLVGLYSFVLEYLKLRRIYYLILIRLSVKGYECDKIYKIVKRFFCLKIYIPRKRKERETQLMMNELVVRMSEKLGIPQYEARAFLKEKCYVDA